MYYSKLWGFIWFLSFENLVCFFMFVIIIVVKRDYRVNFSSWLCSSYDWGDDEIENKFIGWVGWFFDG